MGEEETTSKYVSKTKPTPPPPSSTTTPPRPPSTRTVVVNTASGSGTKRPMTPGKDKTKSGICPICQKDLCHEKALNGHIRWHSLEEREAAGIGVARALASGVVIHNDDVKMQGSSSKRVKLPDLNHSPPPEDDNS